MTREELAAIRARAAEAPGTVGPGPIVQTGYLERFINLLRNGPIYARRRGGREASDAEIGAHLAGLFAPAYAAHRDVEALLAEIDRLREARG